MWHPSKIPSVKFRILRIVQNRKKRTSRFGKSRFLMGSLLVYTHQPTHATYKDYAGQPKLSANCFFIPRELVNPSNETFKSDPLCIRRMTTWETAAFFLFSMLGVEFPLLHFNSLLHVFYYSWKKAYPTWVSINSPASSTLSDANCKRPMSVWLIILLALGSTYQKEISERYLVYLLIKMG